MVRIHAAGTSTEGLYMNLRGTQRTEIVHANTMGEALEKFPWKLNDPVEGGFVITRVKCEEIAETHNSIVWVCSAYIGKPRKIDVWTEPSLKYITHC